MLAKRPDDAGALANRVSLLRSMGELDQALAWMPRMPKAREDRSTQSIAAEVYFARGDDAQAAPTARKALLTTARNQRADASTGHVARALVLVAAEARAGRSGKVIDRRP